MVFQVNKNTQMNPGASDLKVKLGTSAKLKKKLSRSNEHDRKKRHYITKDILNKVMVLSHQSNANTKFGKYPTDCVKLDEMHQTLCKSLANISISNNFPHCDTDNCVINIDIASKLTLESALLISQIVSIDFKTLNKLLQSTHNPELRLKMVNLVLLTDWFYSLLTYDVKYFDIWSKRMDLVRIIEEADERITSRVNLAVLGVLALVATDKMVSRESLIKKVINKTNILDVDVQLALKSSSGTLSERQFISLVYKSQQCFSDNIMPIGVNTIYGYAHGAEHCISMLTNGHRDVISTCVLSRCYFKNLCDEIITREQFVCMFQKILSKCAKTRKAAAIKLRSDEALNKFKLTKLGPAVISMSGKNVNPVVTILKRQKEHHEICDGVNLRFLNGQFMGTKKYEIQHTVEELLQEGCVLDMNQHMHVLLHVPNALSSSSIYVKQIDNKLYHCDEQGQFAILQATDIIEATMP